MLEKHLKNLQVGSKAFGDLLARPAGIGNPAKTDSLRRPESRIRR